MPKGRILALDVGDRRIGLAITDELGLTAQPLFTIHRTSLKADLKSIARFIRQRGVSEVVVGNPLNADGTQSAQAEKTQAFAETLREAHPELTHHLLDERLTTREAHSLLDEAAFSKSRLDRKDLIDQVAATLLLQTFLSQRSGPMLLPDPEDPNL
jgi:putative holliday junction resolvase